MIEERVSATTTPRFKSLSVKVIKSELFLCQLMSFSCGGHPELNKVTPNSWRGTSNNNFESFTEAFSVVRGNIY